jgi:sugar phosphate isomerase/epimerase
MTSRIGLQLYTLRHLSPRQFEDALARVAAIGYAGVETAFFDESVSPRQTARRLSELGLTIISAHTDLPLGDGRDEALRMADELGCSRVIWHGWPRDPRYSSVDGILQLAEEYNAANAVARDNGLSLGLHTHWWECETVEGRPAYRRLLEHIDPDIFIEPDMYWARAAGLDPAAMLTELGPRATLVHIKDGPATYDDPMAPLGSGVLDIPAIVRAGRETTEWTIVELDEVAMDALEAVAQSYRFMVDNGYAHGTRP